MTRRPLTLAVLLAAAVCAAAPSRAHAQRARSAAAAEAALPRREGLVLGVAVGASSLTAGFGNDDFGANEDTKVGATTIDLQFGGMLSRRIALVLHVNIARGADGSAVQYLQAAALVGLRLFVTKVFWFELAFGTSAYQERDTLFDSTLAERAHAYAWMSGIGVEVYQGRGFTVDIRGNIAFAEYPSGFSANSIQGLLGLNWY